jgi:hypothetical protein
VQSFITVGHGKKAKQRARAAALAAGSAPEPIEVADDAQQPPAESAEEVAEDPGVKIAALVKDLAHLEPVKHMPGVDKVYADKSAVLLRLQTEKKAAKEPRLRFLDAGRKEKQGVAKVEKSTKSLLDLIAAHDLVVEKHKVAREAAEASLAADELFLLAARKELFNAAEASAAAVAPVLTCSPAMQIIKNRINADLLLAEAQQALDDAAAAPVPPPSVDPPEEPKARLGPSEAELQRVAAEEAKAAQERIDAEQRDIDARMGGNTPIELDEGDAVMADAEKKRLAAEAVELESENRTKKLKSAVAAAGIKKTSG